MGRPAPPTAGVGRHTQRTGDGSSISENRRRRGQGGPRPRVVGAPPLGAGGEKQGEPPRKAATTAFVGTIRGRGIKHPRRRAESVRAGLPAIWATQRAGRIDDGATSESEKRWRRADRERGRARAKRRQQAGVSDSDRPRGESEATSARRRRATASRRRSVNASGQAERLAAGGFLDVCCRYRSQIRFVMLRIRLTQ